MRRRSNVSAIVPPRRPSTIVGTAVATPIAPVHSGLRVSSHTW
jgi:hypothetical protein